MTLKHFWKCIEGLARRRALSLLLVFFLALAGNYLWSLNRGLPIPQTMDEFSYLLMGDTFAHGRITNPPHPLRPFFETFHVLSYPTRMSKYLPGQGIFLGLGQALFGRPIYGVWISAGLMCMAITWMLYACVPPRWSLIGGLISVFQFGVFTYWSQSYWGGAVAALAGALIFGAGLRLHRGPQLKDALWLGLGLVLLLISRPAEGFLICLPVGVLILASKKLKAKWPGMQKMAVLVVFMAGIIGAGIYNQKVTGLTTAFPEFLYDRTHTSVPLFIWEPPRPAVHLDSKALEDYEQYWKMGYYRAKRTWSGFTQDLFQDMCRLASFYFGYPLALPLVLMLGVFFKRYWFRLGLAWLLIMAASAAMITDARPHYFAPLTGIAVLLVVVGLRGLALLKWRKILVGPKMVMALIIFQCGMNIFLTPVQPRVQALAKIAGPSPVYLPLTFSREELKDILLKKGGKYLVIVQYPFWHNCLREWVNNGADIDGAPIVWAHDRGAQANRILENYFKDRQFVPIVIVWEMRNLPFYWPRQ